MINISKVYCEPEEVYRPARTLIAKIFHKKVSFQGQLRGTFDGRKRSVSLPFDRVRSPNKKAPA